MRVCVSFLCISYFKNQILDIVCKIVRLKRTKFMPENGQFSSYVRLLVWGAWVNPANIPAVFWVVATVMFSTPWTSNFFIIKLLINSGPQGQNSCPVNFHWILHACTWGLSSCPSAFSEANCYYLLLLARLQLLVIGAEFSVFFFSNYLTHLTLSG